MRKNHLLLACLVVFCPASSWAEKKVIAPPELTSAGLPFSPGILIDGTLYVSGQLGRDLKTGAIPEDFEAEVKNCLESSGLILKAAGMSYGDVVAVQVYLTDVSLFQRMNAVYSSVFKEPRPSRTTVGVAKLVAAGARIEITMTARKSK
ncbi:MAG TPA: RidA family protein [Bryobacteraceae bacterium]